jgi:restriction system protein
MAIPSFEALYRPTLELATKGDITRKSAAAAVCDVFGLTQEERDRKVTASHHTVVEFRISWVMSYLTKGGLIEKVAPRTYRATEFGKKFLKDHPVSISANDLKDIPGIRTLQTFHGKVSAINDPADVPNGAGPGRGTPAPISSGTADGGAVPIETIHDGLDRHNAALKSRLMDEILKQDPAFFENLVLDVLVAMGYGGSRTDAAEHLGGSGDEGIDGCIKQDPLGLDLVLVQAKRYKPENAINRETIQSFIGAMSGRGVNKGVFITTSYFNANAKEFVGRGLAQKVILIDGDMLLNLMLKHHVGTRVQEAVEILDLDQNYFNDED